MTLPILLATSLVLSSAAIRARAASETEVAAQNDLGFSLLAESRTSGVNALVSPAGVRECLRLAHEGSAGSVKAELGRLLGIGPGGSGTSGLSASEWPGVTLNVAAGVFVDQRLRPKAEFTAAVAKLGVGGLETIDFQNATASADRINAWVSSRTSGRIAKLVSASDVHRASLALLSALFFKGSWAEPFDKKLTADGEFRSAKGLTKQTKFMKRVARFSYAEDIEAQWIDLPYQGDASSLMVILPRTVEGLAKLEASLNSADLKRSVGMLSPRPGEVLLPRFELKWGPRDLAKTLNAMGYGLKGDFAPMGLPLPNGGKLEKIVHATLLKVDEEGAEAAAATAAVMVPGSARPPSEPMAPFRFEATRPFLLMVRNRISGGILFLGRFSEPD